MNGVIPCRPCRRRHGGSQSIRLALRNRFNGLRNECQTFMNMIAVQLGGTHRDQ
jgi:hypothetical protein